MQPCRHRPSAARAESRSTHADFLRGRKDAEGGHLVYDEASLLGLSKSLRRGLGQDELHIQPQALDYLREPRLLSFARSSS